MKLSFILIGLILILFLFAVFRHKNPRSNLLIILSLIFSVIGEFVGDITTSFFSINILYLFSFLILFFVFCNKSIYYKLYFYLFVSFVIALILFIDLDFLSVFSFALLYMVLAVTFLFFYSSPRNLFVSLLLISFLYFLIDGYFQYVEMGYAIIDFSRMILPVIILCSISYAYTFSSVKDVGRVVYE